VLEDLRKLKEKYKIKKEDYEAIKGSYYGEIEKLKYEISKLTNKLVLYERCIEVFKKSNNTINGIINSIFKGEKK